MYGLPQSWRDFVNPCDISETETKIQSAIWELVTTEVDYIHAIQTVTDVSRFFLLYEYENIFIAAKMKFIVTTVSEHKK